MRTGKRFPRKSAKHFSYNTNLLQNYLLKNQQKYKTFQSPTFLYTEIGDWFDLWQCKFIRYIPNLSLFEQYIFVFILDWLLLQLCCILTNPVLCQHNLILKPSGLYISQRTVWYLVRSCKILWYWVFSTKRNLCAHCLTQWDIIASIIGRKPTQRYHYPNMIRTYKSNPAMRWSWRRG